jgi:hypothetical protein
VSRPTDFGAWAVEVQTEVLRLAPDEGPLDLPQMRRLFNAGAQPADAARVMLDRSQPLRL